MQPRDFCYWLQGFFELTKTDELTPEQVGEIKKHLYNVFQHDCEKIQYDNGKFFMPQIGSIPYNDLNIPVGCGIPLNNTFQNIPSWIHDNYNKLETRYCNENAKGLKPFIRPTGFEPINDGPLYAHPDGRGNIIWSSTASC